MFVGKFGIKVVVVIIVEFMPAKTTGLVAQHLLFSTEQAPIEEQQKLKAFLKLMLHFETLEGEKVYLCFIFSFVYGFYLLPFFFVFLCCLSFLSQRRLRAL